MLALLRMLVVANTLLFAVAAVADEPDHHDHDGEDHDHDHDEGRPVIIDLSGGYGYARNGFIVPAPLIGGLEDGHGAWLHISLHPRRLEWLGFSLGVDVFNKDDGNWGWGLHVGVEFEAHLTNWLRIGISPLLGYHGERRLITLSGQILDRPELLSGFTMGLEAMISAKLWGPFWLVGKAECGLTAPGSHRYWEWECGPRVGLGVHF